MTVLRKENDRFHQGVLKKCQSAFTKLDVTARVRFLSQLAFSHVCAQFVVLKTSRAWFLAITIVVKEAETYQGQSGTDEMLYGAGVLRIWRSYRGVISLESLYALSMV